MTYCGAIQQIEDDYNKNGDKILSYFLLFGGVALTRTSIIPIYSCQKKKKDALILLGFESKPNNWLSEPFFRGEEGLPTLTKLTKAKAKATATTMKDRKLGLE